MFTRYRFHSLLSDPYASTIHLSALDFLAKEKLAGRTVTRASLVKALSENSEFKIELELIRERFSSGVLREPSNFQAEKKQADFPEQIQALRESVLRRFAGQKILGSVLNDLQKNYLIEFEEAPEDLLLSTDLRSFVNKISRQEIGLSSFIRAKKLVEEVKNAGIFFKKISSLHDLVLETVCEQQKKLGKANRHQLARSLRGNEEFQKLVDLKQKEIQNEVDLFIKQNGDKTILDVSSFKRLTSRVLAEQKALDELLSPFVKSGFVTVQAESRKGLFTWGISGFFNSLNSLPGVSKVYKKLPFKAFPHLITPKQLSSLFKKSLESQAISLSVIDPTNLKDMVLGRKRA